MSSPLECPYLGCPMYGPYNNVGPAWKQLLPYLSHFFGTRKQRYLMIGAADIYGFILEARTLTTVRCCALHLVMANLFLPGVIFLLVMYMTTSLQMRMRVWQLRLLQ